MTASTARAGRANCKAAIAVLFATTALALAAAPTLARAADGPATAQPQSGPALPEVVVTARRRAENIQNVPLAVTAFGNAQLKDLQIVQANDLQYSTPSLDLLSNGSTHTVGEPTIRGLGSAQFGVENVLIYFSEANSLTPNLATPLFDVSSVQVLNGPQGTLFGRGSTAGAILIEPQHPQLDHFGGELDATVGTLGTVELTGIVNVPVIADQLALRLDYHSQHIDGYTHPLNPALPALDEINNQSLRVGVEWRPGDSWFSNYLVGEWDNYDQTPQSFVLAGARLNTFTPAQQAVVAAELARVNSSDAAKRYANVTGGAPLVDKGSLYQLVDVAQTDPKDLGFSTVSLKNIFSYQTGGIVSCYDTDPTGLSLQSFCGGYLGDAVSNTGTIVTGGGVPNHVLSVSDQPYLTRYTEEFQVNGDVHQGLLVWTIGGFYQDQPVSPDIDQGGPRTAAYVGSLGVWIGALSYNLAGYEREEAGYGQATLDFTQLGLKGLDFTAGFRHSADQESETSIGGIAFPNAAGQLLPPAVPPGVPTTTASSSAGDSWTLALDYHLTPNAMVYATTRHGYQGGGVNGAAGCSTVPACSPTYSPTTVQDYEVGAKTDFQFAGMTGRIDADVYYEDYDNLQVSLTVPTTTPGVSAIFITNAGRATLDGAEVQFTLIPFKGLELIGQYSHNDFVYNEFLTTDPLLIIPSTVTNPNDPRCAKTIFAKGATSGTCLINDKGQNWTPVKDRGSLTARYDIPVPPEVGDLIASVTVSARGLQWLGSSDVTRELAILGPGYKNVISQPAYALVDARLDWSHIYGSNVDFGLWVRNLANVTYATGGVNCLFTASCGSYIMEKTYGPPRTIGMTFSEKF